MGYWYRTGTISVANGSTTVTGTGTGWGSTVRAGDMLHAGNNPAVEIASVTDNTHFELVQPWPYTTLSGAAYGTELGPGWNDVTRLANEVATALANATEILSGIGIPSNSIGTDGSAYFRQDVAELYFKSSGAWGTAISLVGPTGAKGDKGDKGDTGAANSLAIGTVTTGSPGGSASATITGSAPSQTLNLTIPRGATGATGATGDPGPANGLVIGTVTTGAPGSSADATITGTPPSQTLNLTIPKGDQGPQGDQGLKGDTGDTGPVGPQGQGIQPNATGTFSNRSTYDAQVQGFIYLSTDGDGGTFTGATIFVKNSASSGDWSVGTPLGQLASSSFQFGSI